MTHKTQNPQIMHMIRALLCFGRGYFTDIAQGYFTGTGISWATLKNMGKYTYHTDP